MIHVFVTMYAICCLLQYTCMSSCMYHQGDKVSILTCTYPHKSPRKIVPICSHQANSPLYVWPGA